MYKQVTKFKYYYSLEVHLRREWQCPALCSWMVIIHKKNCMCVLKYIKYAMTKSVVDWCVSPFDWFVAWRLFRK